MVELKENADSTDLALLQQELPQATFVRAVTFVSKQEAADIMRRSLGDEYINPDMPLPFFDAYSVNLKATFMSPDSIDAISTRLRDYRAVNDVYMDEGLIGDVSKTVEQIALFAFGIAALFILVAITLIYNTIRLNLYSDRFIIKNMELVGASWSFISRPYMQRGILNGFLSALLALGMMAGIWYLAQWQTNELNQLLQNPIYWGFIAVLVLLGVLISWLSTYYVVNKYLKMRLDDLY